MSGQAVAVSGGGHRAGLFALGALMYLADSGENEKVTSISSVSGGSMTNGMVAQQLDFRETDGPAFQEAMTPLAHRMAVKGTFQGPPFSVVPRWMAVLTLLPLAIFFLPDLSRWMRLGMYGLLTAIVVSAIVCGYRLFATPLGLVFGSLTFGLLPTVIVAPWVAPISIPSSALLTSMTRLVTFVVLILLWGWVFQLRGRVCTAAFRKTLFTTPNGPTLLAGTHARGIDHVFCATELQSSEQVYFGKDFIYGYRFGKGVPASLSLAEAVQSSANLPGAFPPKWMPAGPHGFSYPADEPVGTQGPCPPERDRPSPYPPASLVLSDGGVYDNMGDQWPMGFEGRKKCWPSLASEHNEPNCVIVVNASGGQGWQSMQRARIPLLAEIAGLMKVKDVLYDQTTAQRRFGLVARFERARLEGEGLRGALVNIPQSPFKVPLAFAPRDGAQPEDERQARALAAIALLETPGEPSRAEWDEIARRNDHIKTALCAVGPDSAQLLRHAWVLTAVNLHVLLGMPLPSVLPPLTRFEAMAHGRVPDPVWTFVRAS